MRGWSSLGIAAIFALSVVGVTQPVQAQEASVPSCRNAGYVTGGTVSGQICRESGSASSAPGVPGGPEVLCTYSPLGSDTEVEYYPSPGSSTGYSSGFTTSAGVIEITDVTINIGSGGNGSSLEFDTYTADGVSREFTENGTWYRRACTIDGVAQATEGPIPSGPTVSIEQLVERALAELDLIVPEEFQHTGQEEGSVLQIPTFVWLDELDMTTPLTASSGFGNVEVIVTANPTNFRFELDGTELVSCEQRNVEWSRGLDEGVGCTYTLEDAPENGESVFIDLEVIYAVRWDAAAIGEGDSLGDVPVRTEDIEHPVFEVVGLTSAG